MNRHSYPVVQAVYATTPSNLGDLASCPLNYYRFKRDGAEVRTMHLHVRHEVGKAGNHPTIWGGGGLCKPNNPLNEWQAATSRFVVWGAGLNMNNGRHQQYGSGWLDEKSRSRDYRQLVGVRDDNAGPRWVPCASCMHPLFDEFADAEPTREVVVYEGFDLIATDYPRLSCWGLRNMRQAVEFLASGETVVTASYHGAYWATLLGRRVAVIPELRAAKFYHLRWPVPLGEPEELPRLIREAVAHPGAMDEARERTEWYAGQVGEFLGMEVERVAPFVA